MYQFSQELVHALTENRKKAYTTKRENDVPLVK